jgi:hypothetical protein
MMKWIQGQACRVFLAVAVGWTWTGLATTNIVQNLNDGFVAGTLRYVIANSAPGDTVVFKGGLSGTISLTSGQLLIDKNLIVQGPGAKVITVSGNHNSRVFNLTNANINISGLTIVNGQVTGAYQGSGNSGETVIGGGLLRLDSVPGYSVAISDCIFLGNSIVGGIGGGLGPLSGAPGGDAEGGGVFNNSSLTLSNCCFAGNTVVGGRGGIDYGAGGKGGLAAGAGAYNTGTIVMINCTFATNTATGGACGDTPGGPGAFTFPGSGGNGEGSAIYNTGEIMVSSCTIARNMAVGGAGGSDGVSGGINGANGKAYGAGIQAVAGTATIRNTILAGNAAQQAEDVSGNFVSAGFNLIGTTNGSAGFDSASDQTGTTNSPIAPLLGAFQYNGGSTLTFALLSNSPAVDRGNSFGVSTDQRGAPRPSVSLPGSKPGDGSDIGTFELIPAKVGIMREGKTIVLSWSVYNTDFALQSTTNIASGNWLPVIGTPFTMGDRFYLTNSITSGAQFFRLH